MTDAIRTMVEATGLTLVSYTASETHHQICVWREDGQSTTIYTTEDPMDLRSKMSLRNRLKRFAKGEIA